MHALLRGWIIDVLRRHQPVVAIALRQRAKFEGWLKFELAAYAEENGARGVEVEASSADSAASRRRAHLSFYFDQVRYDLELKTPNSSWRVPGVDDKTRPITKNVAGIVSDARKLFSSPNHGLVAFVLFPVPEGDRRWVVYLGRIAQELQIELSASAHTSQVTFPLSDSHVADVVVCCFPTPGDLDVRQAKVPGD